MIKTEFRITNVKLLKDTIEKIQKDIKDCKRYADEYKKKELINTMILGALMKALKELKEKDKLMGLET